MEDEGKGSDCKLFLYEETQICASEEKKMKAKVNVVLNQTQSGRPILFVELVDTTIEAVNSPNKKWNIHVPSDNPVSDSELKLILRQLGLENKYLPKTSLINNLFKEAFSPFSLTTLILKNFFPKVCPSKRKGTKV